MKTIYLLMSRVDYEGSDPVLAFNNEIDAKAWEEKANDWLTGKPTIFIDDEDNWDRYDADYAEWSKSIPELSSFTVADGFYVTSIEIKS